MSACMCSQASKSTALTAGGMILSVEHCQSYVPVYLYAEFIWSLVAHMSIFKILLLCVLLILQL